MENLEKMLDWLVELDIQHYKTDQFDKDLSKELNGQKLPIEEFCYRVYEEIEKKDNIAFEAFIITMAVLYGKIGK